MNKMTLPSDAPPPRLCIVEKRDGETEYGYNLHAERGRQFVGLVDANSPAQRGGLIQGDRIYAVNGHSIIGQNHKQVVDRIRTNPKRCEILVVSEEEEQWYINNKVEINLDLPNIVKVGEERVQNGSPPPNGSWYAPQPTTKTTEPAVFNAPPPPPATAATTDKMNVKPLPRLAKLEKSSPIDEFGFNLHAEKNQGHFIGTVDVGGIAEHAGLRLGQRIVGVNHQNIYPNTPHKDVVALIKKYPLHATLLVASEDVDSWYRTNGVEYSFEEAEAYGVEHEQKHEHREEVNQLSPHSIQIGEEVEVSLNHQAPAPVIPVITAPVYDAYSAPPPPPPPPATNDDLIDQVFGRVDLPAVAKVEQQQKQEHDVYFHDALHKAPSVEVTSLTLSESLRGSTASFASSCATSLDQRQLYVPSYTTTRDHQVPAQQPSPLSNASSSNGGYANSLGSGSGRNSVIAAEDKKPFAVGYEDDIYHLSAKEARERLRNKNKKNRVNEMSLNEKYQLISNL